MKKKLLLGLLCTSLIMTGCGKVAELKNGEQVVAKMKGKNITADALYTKLKKKTGSTMLVNLIDEYIANKEMKTTDEIKKSAQSTYDQYKKQYESYGQDFEQVIKSSGYESSEEFLNELILSKKREEVAKKFIKKALTDDEINEYYENNIYGDLTARHILISPDVKDDMTAEEKEKAEKKALKKAQKLIEELNNGADFETLAKENSDDEGSKEKGGLIENFNKDDVVESFFNATINLQDGEYTKEPVESDYGYHIILRVSQKKKPSLKKSKSKIEDALVKQKMDADANLTEKTWVDIRKQYKLDIQDDELKDGYNKIVDSIDGE